MNIALICLLTLFVLSVGFSFSDSHAIISPNSGFTLEGSGYAITKETIKTSEINLDLSTQKQTGNIVNSSIEDGFITLDNENFPSMKLETTVLQEGKYIRITGIVENETGDKASIKFFGRLVEQSKDASIYGFTGKIITDNDEYKIIYTTKLSELLKINVKPIDSKITEKKLVIHIAKGSSTQGVGNYIDLGAAKQQAVKTQSSTDYLRFRYFSQDRISIEPGTTITIINDDSVPHSILSGKELSDRHKQFTPDGRISTDKILPGQSVDITLDKAGFYRLYDPDYQWMEIITYVFPNVDKVILGQGKYPSN